MLSEILLVVAMVLAALAGAAIFYLVRAWQRRKESVPEDIREIWDLTRAIEEDPHEIEDRCASQRSQNHRIHGLQPCCNLAHDVV